MKQLNFLKTVAGLPYGSQSIAPGARVWGRREDQGCGKYPSQVHVEVLGWHRQFSAERLLRQTYGWVRISKKRQAAIERMAQAIAREENERAIKSGKLELWLDKNGEYTKEFKRRFNRAKNCGEIRGHMDIPKSFRTGE